VVIATQAAWKRLWAGDEGVFVLARYLVELLAAGLERMATVHWTKRHESSWGPLGQPKVAFSALFVGFSRSP
jgi:hypothetical protein